MTSTDHCCFFVGRRETSQSLTPKEAKNAAARLLVQVHTAWKNIRSGKTVRVVEVRPCRGGHLVYYQDEKGYSRKADLDEFYKRWQEQ